MSPPLIIVGHVDVRRAPAPQLADYDQVPDEVTEQLADPYECCWELVREDRGGCRTHEGEAQR